MYVLTQYSGSALLPADCALVFGAGIWGTDTASPSVLRRTSAAAALYKEGKVKKLILSGGKGDERRASEASVMRKVALRLGVDPDDILLEESSTSTLENLQYSREFLAECDTVVGVSDHYHLARIELLAARLGIDNFTTVGAGDRPPFFPHEVKSVIREGVGILYYGTNMLLR